MVRLGMECYRLTYSLGSMLAQNCHKKTAQKAGSCVDRACRCRRFLVSKTRSIGHGDISFFETGIRDTFSVNLPCGELTN